jgi:DNA-binding SARP family transcriptional activator/tetratricopeptide (TPR) repeat protein
MDFRLLGPFEAWHGDVRVDLGDLQQRHVLAVLLLRANKPVSVERLIDIIWGEKRPKTNLVTGYIAKIRRAFREAGADATVHTTPTGYLLEVDERALDTVKFAALCDEAATAKHDGDLARATSLLRAAVALWRGPYLEDLDIDRLGGAAVAIPDDQLIDALGDLAELELEAGNHRWVRNRLRQPVNADPSRQRLAALLMRGLLANGDRVQAMEVYHRTKAALDGYGMEPSIALRSLAKQAQYGPARSTLPPRSSRFTGRTAELAEIEALAASSSDRPTVVWLSGMPGVGKTTVAVEAAYRIRERFTDARLFVQLNGFTANVRPTTPIEALGQLLIGLGVPAEQVPASLTDRIARYQDELTDTRTLVVLDNANSEEQVRALLPDAPTCMAIVTSRKVGDLEIATNLRLEPMAEGDAVDLFRDLVGQKRVQGRTRQVEEVVTRCGRVPLQITVVASQFRRHDRWPLDHLLDLLEKAGPWQLDDGFDDDGVVACTVSYQQLDEPERKLFRMFGHFPGYDVGQHGAAALIDTEVRPARAALEHLHGVSLLDETPTPNRYLMLDPLKNFAAAVPADPAEHRDGLARLLDFYLVSTSSAVSVAFPFDRDLQPRVDVESPVGLSFQDRKEAMAWLGDERPNLVACIRYAADHGLPGHTWRLAVLLWRYLHTTGYLRDWIESLELARRVTAGDPDNQHGHAEVLLRLSIARWRSGELDVAFDLAASALPLIGDVRGEADALCGMALVAIDQGRYRTAMDNLTEALAKYKEIDYRRGQAHVLSTLGHLNEIHGALEEAERQHIDAIALLRSIEHQAGLADAIDNLGSVRQRLGHLDQALADHEEARRVAVDARNSTAEAYALNNLGNTYRRLGRLDEAFRHHALAAAANPVPEPTLKIQLHLDHGTTLLVSGDSGGARREYRAALTLAEKIGDRSQRAMANLGLARILHGIGAHPLAARHWRAAESEFGELELPEAEEIRAELGAMSCACVPG